MAEDRTEQPTARRRRDARRKGQIARSRDVEAVAQLVAVTLVLVWAGRHGLVGMGALLRAGLERLARGPSTAIDPGELAQLATGGAVALGVIVAPVAVAAAGATLLAAAAQGGWNVATEALTPDWQRLSPANGIRRFGFSRAGFDLLKVAIAITLLSWVTVRVVLSMLDASMTLGRAHPVTAAAAGWAFAERLLIQSTIALSVVAGGDYLLQRWRLSKSLRMTKQEVRDDMRLIEGNPEVKARVRRLQRDMARRRMLTAVPKATVVVTNPTHYAVALLYQRDRMAAPQVVAKGRDLLAQRIRDLAREHGVPIVENVPLAQALYRGVEVGESIPADLFGAVAEVLAYLVRLKQLVL